MSSRTDKNDDDNAAHSITFSSYRPANLALISSVNLT